MEPQKNLTITLSNDAARSAMEWLDAFHQINGSFAPNHPLFALREALKSTMSKQETGTE